MYKYFSYLWLVTMLWGTAQAQSVTHSYHDQNGGGLTVGDELTYTVTLTNDTTDTLSAVTLEESAPAGTVLDEGSFVTSKGSISVNDKKVRLITLDVGEMAPDEVVTFQYDVQLTGSPIYFVNSASPPAIYQLDPSTGQASHVADMTGQTAVYGLGLTSDAKTLYGVNSATDSLVKLDLRTNETTVVGPLNLGRNVGVPCLDLTPQDGIYAADSRNDTFFQIDPETGQAFGETSLNLDIRGGDCAFAADGRLLVMSNTNNGKGALWRKDFENNTHQLVANVSDTEFFTGVALGHTGLYASGTDTDSLWTVNPSDGQGSAIGSLGIAHGGGDLAMAASQTLQLRVTGTMKYNVDGEVQDEIVAEIVGTVPPVTDGDNPNQTAPMEDPAGICYDDGNVVCHLPANFASRMQTYVNDVVNHHFSGVEDTMGKEAARRELEGDGESGYFSDAYGVINPARAQAQTDAEAIVQAFITQNDNQPGYCEHESVLMKSVREMLTYRQAVTALGVRGVGVSQTHACQLEAQDTLIRYGDTIALGWDSVGASMSTISPYVGDVTASGMTSIRPLETTTYSLDVGGGVNCSVRVVVEPACDIGFTSIEIAQGQSTQLIWNAEGNAAASISGVGGVPLKGVMSVTPAETTTYTLSTASGKVCSRTVEVVDQLSCEQ